LCDSNGCLAALAQSKDVLELRRIEVEMVRTKQWIVSKCFAFFLLGIPLSA
jgi:hypothetical protein